MGEKEKKLKEQIWNTEQKIQTTSKKNKLEKIRRSNQNNEEKPYEFTNKHYV